jgi:hypothetical protein
MLHHDDELPEDHNALLDLAAGVHLETTPFVMDPTHLPEQRGIAISEEASSLVDGSMVGFATHGR